MNKKSISALLITFCSYHALADDNQNTSNLPSIDTAPIESKKVNLSLSFGDVAGESTELVYIPSQNYKLSELDWKINNLATIKANIDFAIHPLITLNANGWLSLAKGSGYMDDYDWIYTNQSEYSHHSWHSNTDVDYGNEFDVNAKFWMSQRQNTKLGLMVGYQETRFAWTAYGGEYSYYNGQTTGSFDDDQKTISYSQLFQMPYIGIILNSRINNFEYSLLFKASNAVTASDVDEHYLRNLTFEEYATNSSSYYGAILNFGYYLNKNIKLFTEVNYNQFKEAKASTKKTNNSTGSVSYNNGDVAGLANTYYGVNLGVQYNF